MGNRIQRRFEHLRKTTEQDVNAQTQQASEGLERQAAAKGRLGGGSHQKLQLQQQKQAADLKNRAIGDVNAQEEAALGQQEELQAQRDFAKSERLGGQEFANQQGEIQRGFMRSEREGSQSFANAQALAQRGFDEKLFNKNMKFQEKTLNNQSAQFKEQMAMAMMQFGLDEKVSNFNMGMADKEFNKPQLMDIVWTSLGKNPKSGKRAGNNTVVDPAGISAGMKGF